MLRLLIPALAVLLLAACDDNDSGGPTLDDIEAQTCLNKDAAKPDYDVEFCLELFAGLSDTMISALQAVAAEAHAAGEAEGARDARFGEPYDEGWRHGIDLWQECTAELEAGMEDERACAEIGCANYPEGVWIDGKTYYFGIGDEGTPGECRAIFDGAP